MSDYTPTTEQVEFAYANDSEDEYRDPIGYPALVRQNKVAFRRWLAAHDAVKRAEWEAEQGEPEKPSERIHQLIHDLTDPGECWFDHHGGCQEHGYLTLQPGEKCPHAEARELLAEWAVPDTTNETGDDQ